MRQIVWTRLAILTGALLAVLATAAALPATARDGDFVVRDFRFRSGETLPELRLHYLTLGQPARDASGQVTNGVLILHGTGGTGRQFLAPQFAGILFGAGALLDTSRYYVVLPEASATDIRASRAMGSASGFPITATTTWWPHTTCS